MPRLLPGREPSCKVRQSAAQSIPNATYSALLMDTEEWDPSDMHSTVTNTSRVTIAESGLYLVIGQILYANQTTGERRAVVVTNGVLDAKDPHVVIRASAGAAHLFEVVGELSLVAGDYVELYGYHNQGAALSTAGGGYTHLSVRRVGARP